MKRIIAIVISFIFTVSATPMLFGAQYHFSSRGDNSERKAEFGVHIPFGHGSHPYNENLVEKLKKEKTQGAGTAFALVILGVCIVVAAVIIANTADDVAEDVLDEADEIQASLDDKYDDLQKEKDELEKEYK